MDREPDERQRSKPEYKERDEVVHGASHCDALR